VLGMMPSSRGKTTITAHVPLAECQRYATDLRSLSQARGTFTMKFDHYEDVPSHVIEQLVEEYKQSKEHHG